MSINGGVPESLERARDLRRRMTGPERNVWSRLRDRQLCGLKFRRQAPLGPYIVDFYCAEHSLVIELDGKSHDGRCAYDMARTRALERLGLRVMRFDNDDALRDIDSVMNAILLAAGINPDASPPAR
ncbi:MAG: DUF559 domain-containing protein [Pirellulales bacterium]|nr:DUF559 domain-containing protein [Pirellulales bacterium]